MSKITSVKVKGDNGYTEIPIGLSTTEIPENTDLNTLTDTGWYMSNTSTVTATLAHCPTDSAFALEVYDNGKNASGTGKYQHISTYANPPIHYNRRINVNGTPGSWQEWKLTDTTYEAATTSAAGLMSAVDKTKLDGIPTGTDVKAGGLFQYDTITTEGIEIFT